MMIYLILITINLILNIKRCQNIKLIFFIQTKEKRFYTMTKAAAAQKSEMRLELKPNRSNRDREWYNHKTNSHYCCWWWLYYSQDWSSCLWWSRSRGWSSNNNITPDCVANVDIMLPPLIIKIFLPKTAIILNLHWCTFLASVINSPFAVSSEGLDTVKQNNSNGYIIIVLPSPSYPQEN